MAINQFTDRPFPHLTHTLPSTLQIWPMRDRVRSHMLMASSTQCGPLLWWKVGLVEGSNSASGSVRTCNVAALGSASVLHRRGLWRFTSHPSTLETVYISWLAWPCKWWSHLTNIEWDVKEPLRTTCSLAVTTLSVPIHLKCILDKHAGHQGAVTLDWKVLGTGLGCCGFAPCPWARHFSCMCTLSTQEWIGTWLDSDCLCVWIVTSAMMAAGLYATQGVELVLEQTGPVTRENWCEVHRNIIYNVCYISTPTNLPLVKWTSSLKWPIMLGGGCSSIQHIQERRGLCTRFIATAQCCERDGR